MTKEIVTPWLTQREAAKYLHLRADTFNRLVQAGYVKARQVPVWKVGLCYQPAVLYDARELDKVPELVSTEPVMQIIERSRIAAEAGGAA